VCAFEDLGGLDESGACGRYVINEENAFVFEYIFINVWIERENVLKIGKTSIAVVNVSLRSCRVSTDKDWWREGCVEVLVDKISQ